jgi:probable HAF family extracellular repeat protein
VVVGWSSSGFGDEVYRWTQAGGMVGLGDLPGGIYKSLSPSISADGSVVVGMGNSASGQEAFRWTQAGGMVGLGDLPGGIFDSRAFNVSADGLVVVGLAESALGREGFSWTQAGGMVGIGDLPGGSYWTEAFAVSADGSVVVGRSKSGSGTEAFIWDNVNVIPMRSLRDILINVCGLDLTGWTLKNALGISDDGLTIVGTGTNPSGHSEGWIATIPITGDINLDGQVDGLDLNILGVNWLTVGTTWATGDLNGDGATTGLDLNILGANWQFGVPGPGAAIPEPGTFGVLVGLGIGMMVRRRKRGTAGDRKRGRVGHG